MIEMSMDVEVSDKIKKLAGDSLVRRAILKSMRETALETEAAMKRGAPVDTGNLKRSIGVYQVTDTGFAIKGASYGIYLEYGTYKMSAQPFIQPAADKVYMLIQKRMHEHLRGMGLV